jgi:hypothetical protein
VVHVQIVGNRVDDLQDVGKTLLALRKPQSDIFSVSAIKVACNSGNKMCILIHELSSAQSAWQAVERASHLGKATDNKV